MEEKEMNKKNKTVFIVIIIILVILLCVGAFFLGRWITNKETNNETNNPIEVSDVLESVLPSDNIISSVLYTEEDIDAYEFFEQNRTSYFDTGDAEFIKIENNKLMWNINNVWVYDEVITDDVAIVDLEEHSGSGWFTGYILTTNDNLYYVSIDNVDAINIYPELIERVTNAVRRMDYLPIVVSLSFIAALIISGAANIIYKILANGCNKIKILLRNQSRD